jgi:hypothetical protein
LLGPRARALNLIHSLGFPQDAARWRRFCDDRGLLLFEDATRGWLSSDCGRPLGSLWRSRRLLPVQVIRAPGRRRATRPLDCARRPRAWRRSTGDARPSACGMVAWPLADLQPAYGTGRTIRGRRSPWVRARTARGAKSSQQLPRLPLAGSGRRSSPPLALPPLSRGAGRRRETGVDNAMNSSRAGSFGEKTHHWGSRTRRREVIFDLLSHDGPRANCDTFTAALHIARARSAAEIIPASGNAAASGSACRRVDSLRDRDGRESFRPRISTVASISIPGCTARSL